MNQELNTLLKGNSLEAGFLAQQLSIPIGKLGWYKSADEIEYKFKLFTNIRKLGYIIPYHHRPKCRSCGTRYQPLEMRQYYCSECKGSLVFDLTPSDLIELGYSPKEVAAKLGLPATKKIINILEQWNDELEDKLIARLKKALNE